MKITQIETIAAVMDAGRLAVAELEEELPEEKQDHRKLPRANRRKFRHAEALHCIKRDYLGIPGDPLTPLLGADFKSMFRVSRTRFQVMMEDVQASGYQFYQRKRNLAPEDQASFEAQLLLPIKTLAYGVPCHTFKDYFQMSDTYARDACLHFDRVIKIVLK